jgi:putative salt-induced outer membrane protein
MLHRKAFALSLAALAPLSAAAQDSQDTQDSLPPPTAWTGSGELGLALTRGNSRSENLNAKLSLAYEDVQWKHSLAASALRAKGEVAGDFNGDGIEDTDYRTSANRYELAASSAYRFDPRNHLSGNLRYENDDFSAFDYQATAALGYGHRFIDGERTRLLGEIGPGYRRAREADTGLVQDSLIARGLLDFRHGLTANTELVDTLLVESGKDNTFVQNDLGVSVAMNEHFALKAGLQARHNTHVDQAAGTRRTDTLTTVNLVYNFR